MAHLARWMEHVQFNGAFVEDGCLWVVSGTHAAPLLPEQRAVLRRRPGAEQEADPALTARYSKLKENPFPSEMAWSSPVWVDRKP